MSLRESIMFLLDDRNIGFDSIDTEFRDEILGEILALIDSQPSELVAIDKDGNERVLTVKEALEVLRLFLTGHATYQSIHPSGYYIKLPSGERVEVSNVHKRKLA